MAPRKRKRSTAQERWLATVEEMHTLYPHLMGFCGDSESFLGLHVKVKDDGSVLAVVKGYDGDGRPIVCFGVGYDMVLALLALDTSVNGDNWREDKPWKPG